MSTGSRQLRYRHPAASQPPGPPPVSVHRQDNCFPGSRCHPAREKVPCFAAAPAVRKAAWPVFRLSANIKPSDQRNGGNFSDGLIHQHRECPPDLVCVLFQDRGQLFTVKDQTLPDDLLFLPTSAHHQPELRSLQLAARTPHRAGGLPRYSNAQAPILGPAAGSTPAGTGGSEDPGLRINSYFSPLKPSSKEVSRRAVLSAFPHFRSAHRRAGAFRPYL